MSVSAIRPHPLRQYISYDTIIEEQSAPSVTNASSEKPAFKELTIAWEFCEYTNEGKDKCYKREIETFTIPVPITPTPKEQPTRRQRSFDISAPKHKDRWLKSSNKADVAIFRKAEEEAEEALQAAMTAFGIDSWSKPWDTHHIAILA